MHREKGQRKALIRSLASAFFTNSQIKTTTAKAKELRPYVERLITRAKKGTLADTRAIAAELPPVLVKKVSAVAKDYASRNGGYTRITKLGRRSSDGSEMAVIELVK